MRKRSNGFAKGSDEYEQYLNAADVPDITTSHTQKINHQRFYKAITPNAQLATKQQTSNKKP